MILNDPFLFRSALFCLVTKTDKVSNPDLLSVISFNGSTTLENSIVAQLL